MNNGFIKLHRKLIESDLFSRDGETVKMAIYCLMRANFKPRTVYGQELQPGEFITSLDKLCAGLGLSRQQVRTRLVRLSESCDFLTHRSTNKYTIISIKNWDLYQQTQETNTEDNKQLTNKQQTNNTQLTTDKNVKKEKKERIEENTLTAHPVILRFSHKEILSEQPYCTYWQKMNPTEQEQEKLITEFPNVDHVEEYKRWVEDCEAKNLKYDKPYFAFKKYLRYAKPKTKSTKKPETKLVNKYAEYL